MSGLLLLLLLLLSSHSRSVRQTGRPSPAQHTSGSGIGIGSAVTAGWILTNNFMTMPVLSLSITHGRVFLFYSLSLSSIQTREWDRDRQRKSKTRFFKHFIRPYAVRWWCHRVRVVYSFFFLFFMYNFLFPLEWNRIQLIEAYRLNFQINNNKEKTKQKLNYAV